MQLQFLRWAKGFLVEGRDGWIMRKTPHGMFCAISLLHSQGHWSHSVSSLCWWWLSWQQDCNSQNLHLVLELRGSLVCTSALHLQAEAKANSQLSTPPCTPVLTWYFKRLRNVNVHDLKTVSSFQSNCSLSFFRLYRDLEIVFYCIIMLTS